MDYKEIFEKSVSGSKVLALASEDKINRVLLRLSDLLMSRDAQEKLIAANSLDLQKMSQENPLYDRLRLTEERIEGIASDLQKVASLKSPVGEIIESRRLPNGIDLKKVRVPFGVIGVIYEARPNVTFDVFSLCLKSGNACVLKGGKDAVNSNEAAMRIIYEALDSEAISHDSAILLPSTHEATSALLNARGYVDLCIPRGGRGLIDFVRENAKIPVIETGAGVVHLYFAKDGDIEIGKRVIRNSKTRRVSVCNALDTLLINRARLDVLPLLVEALAHESVKLFADIDSFKALEGHYPEGLLYHADEECWDREWMDYKMGIWACENLADAISHIDRHGSGHSESIVTDNKEESKKFEELVDASCVYVNLPTSFTDGAQFGLGAEIGISTQKLGPRGPMGLTEMTTYRYILEGEGQIRPK